MQKNREFAKVYHSSEPLTKPYRNRFVVRRLVLVVMLSGMIEFRRNRHRLCRGNRFIHVRRIISVSKADLRLGHGVRVRCIGLVIVQVGLDRGDGRGLCRGNGFVRVGRVVRVSKPDLGFSDTMGIVRPCSMGGSRRLDRGNGGRLRRGNRFVGIRCVVNVTEPDLDLGHGVRIVRPLRMTFQIGGCRGSNRVHGRSLGRRYRFVDVRGVIGIAQSNLGFGDSMRIARIVGMVG